MIFETSCPNFHGKHPGNPQNARIVDLDRADRARDGHVPFTADLMVLRPADQARGNGAHGPWAGSRGAHRYVGALARDLDTWATVAPAAFTSSLAFILVSEGPTTVIPYASGYFSIKDMARAGLWMTVAAAACVTVAVSIGQALGF